ncbi:uncharacterized protein [Dysidea avara]|uniref:uncharacterized protein isoform X2 n=1 Tax=Dysidea avara TaxID=196820 RepID=UPI00331A29DA
MIIADVGALHFCEHFCRKPRRLSLHGFTVRTSNSLFYRELSGPDDNGVVEDLKPGGVYILLQSITASAGEFTALESSPAHYALPAETPLISTPPAPKIAAKSKPSDGTHQITMDLQ